MDVRCPRCAWLDVHKDTVVACARLVRDGCARHDVETFGTSAPGLFAQAGWLEPRGRSHFAVEATGVHWQPVGHVLQGHVELVPAHAAHARNVPRRKTDVRGAR